jgi:hypothetical protein
MMRRPKQRLIEVDPLDPAAPVPPNLASLMDHLAVNPSEFSRNPWPSAAEHRFDEREPMLARFAPQEISGCYRRVIQSAPERQAVGLRQPGWMIPKHLLLNGPEEAHALEQARRSLLPLPESDLQDARDTEAWILTGVLGHLTAEQQLDLLLARPESALDFVVFENVFAAVPPERAHGRLIRVVAEGQAYEVRRLLWFLSRSAFTLSVAARNTLISCFSHTDAGVRANAFRLAVRCNDRRALSVHVASGWCARLEDSIDESFYGSHALIAGANPVDYLALRSRVAPELLGYLALQDGSPCAIDAFAEDLDGVWEAMTRPPMLPPDRARVWFAEFLARHDPVEAWAAFRLFLPCIDRRFHLWGDAMHNATPDLPLLWHQQVYINDQNIQRAMEKNEGRLSDILIWVANLKA